MKYMNWALAGLLSLTLGGQAVAQSIENPDSLPPLDLPQDLPSDETPVISPPAEPTSSPTPSAQPVLPSNLKLKLQFEFPKEMTEGQTTSIRLRLQGVERLPLELFPIKGVVEFEDKPYNLSATLTRSYAFEMDRSGLVNVPVLFYTPGKKTVQIKTNVKHIAPRNVLTYIQPFKATTFPRSVNTEDFSSDPSDWNVWVNLHVSHSPKAPQRQYYLIVHKNEIVQKLLTSSGAADHSTPHGKFKLGAKIASPRSTKYDSVMPFWTTIKVPRHTFEYGNHGLLGESYLYHLGTPASHGCLRLSNKWVKQNDEWLNIGGAKWVYTHVPVNTSIQIFRKAAPQPFVYENYRMWLASSR